MDRQKMRETGRKKLEEFRRAKERRAAVMAAAAAKAVKDAQFLDDSASSTLGGGGVRVGAAAVHVGGRARDGVKPPWSNNSRGHDHTVADLESLRAFGMITPPREDIGATAAAAARALGLESSPRDVDDLLAMKHPYVLPTTPEQDPLVEMLTRQVRSLQREKAEMGEENAALRREVRSLEDLVESLENLLESGCVEEAAAAAAVVTSRGGERVFAQATEEEGEAKPSQTTEAATAATAAVAAATAAATAAAAAERFLAASEEEEVSVRVQVPIVSSSVRRHDRAVSSSGRTRNSYVCEWLDDAVASRREDIERSIGDTAAAAGAAAGAAVGAAGERKGKGDRVGRRQFSSGVEARTSDPRRRLSDVAGFVGKGDSPLDHRRRGGGGGGVGDEGKGGFETGVGVGQMGAVEDVMCKYALPVGL